MDPAFLDVAGRRARGDAHLPGRDRGRGGGCRLADHTVHLIELPIELNVSRDDSGALVLGTAPPIYYVDTSYRPSYHRIRVTATLSDAPAPPDETPDGR